MVTWDLTSPCVKDFEVLHLENVRSSWIFLCWRPPTTSPGAGVAPEQAALDSLVPWQQDQSLLTQQGIFSTTWAYVEIESRQIVQTPRKIWNGFLPFQTTCFQGIRLSDA